MCKCALASWCRLRKTLISQPPEISKFHPSCSQTEGGVRGDRHTHGWTDGPHALKD